MFWTVLRFILQLFTYGLAGTLAVGGLLAAGEAGRNNEGGKVLWGIAVVFELTALMLLVGNGVRWENFAIGAVIVAQVVWFFVTRRSRLSLRARQHRA